MTEEEIAARKFAMESMKENQASKEKEEARRKAEKEGRTFDERSYEKASAGGRPEGAKVAGAEPAKTETETEKTGEGRIAVNGKAAADSLSLIDEKKKEEEQWMKTEYVPVTSFIHTMKYDNFRRIYQAYQTPSNFYKNTFDNVGIVSGDSILDKTSHYRLQNTFAISLLEGFNKWAKAGLKAFVTSDLRHFTLPDSTRSTTSYTEHNLSIGAQLIKRLGRTFHYDVTAETWLVGKDVGSLKVDANADVNFALFGDTVRLAARGFFHSVKPSFYYRHYQAKHYWWDNDDLSKIIHSRVEGVFTYEKTNTTLRVAFDNLKNYTYFVMSYDVDADTKARTANTVRPRQSGSPISLLTLSLEQNFKLGPLHWENLVTYQKSSNADALPVPDLNVYTNLYLKFRIAKVLKCDFGADARYFTKYYAPDYSPALGQFCVQEGNSRTEVGNYPVVNVYANFHLQHTRFFVMMSHVNAGQGNRNYFFTPHYPLNERIFRFGISWNFFN